jgi:large repetitive protein
MKVLTFLIIIVLQILLAACQVKPDASSGIIANHSPATNQLTLGNLAAKTYVAGEEILFTLQFPLNMIVTGVPRLELTIDSTGLTPRYANYLSGSGSKTLTFRYLVDANDNDSNGIEVKAFDLNSATLQFDDQGTLTNINTSVQRRHYSHVLIDNSPPQIIGFKLNNPAGLYGLNDIISITVTYSEPVFVAGNPSIPLTFNFPVSTTVQATYAGGSGTTALLFSYTISNLVADLDGYGFTSPFVLNTGTIKDAANHDASLDFSNFMATAVADSNNAKIDGRIPRMVSVTPPANGTYGVSQALDVLVEFDRLVKVTGVPYIILNLESIQRQAIYVSGDESNVLTFRYVTVPGDIDPNGIAIASQITQAAGSNITNYAAQTNGYFTYSANNILVSPSTAGVRVAAIQPQATSVIRNQDTTNPSWGTGPDNVWIIGQQLLITVGFNTAVFVNQTSGTPRIPLTIGSSTRYANYLSGGDGQTSLVFRYVIQEGDLDSDGSIGLGSIDLNGGTITDSVNTNSLLNLPSAALTTTRIDGVRPTISSVTKPSDGTYSTITGNNHINMAFTINWSEAVRYTDLSTAGVFIPINIGGTNLNATYISGDQTAAIIHRVSSLANRNDSDGITLSSPLGGTSVIRDQAGNEVSNKSFTVPVTTGVLVDTTAPTVSSIDPPASGVYTLGQNIDFLVNFSEVVTVNIASGYPRIPITIGSTLRYLIPTANGSGTTHTFRYTVVAGESDNDGVTLGNSVTSNGSGYARDAGRNNVAGTFMAPNTSGIIVDSVPATVTAVTPPSNGTYEPPSVLTFSLTFSEAVTVTDTPRIELQAQTGQINLNYASGSGTTTLNFEYTVGASDFDFDGLGSVSSIALNGGTIKDLNGVTAVTTFSAQNLSQVFLSYNGIKVWAGANFANRAANSTYILFSGAASLEGCGTSQCATFNGESLSINNPYNGVRTLFIVLKTSINLANYTLIDSLISLDNDGSTYDISMDGNLLINGSAPLYNAPTYDANLGLGQTYVLQADFTFPQDLSGTIIPSSFRGAIGEIIMINGTLDASQKSQIRTYLDNKF